MSNLASASARDELQLETARHLGYVPGLADFSAVILKQQREAGPAPPPRLTAHQRQIVVRLIAAHGDDVEVPCLVRNEGFSGGFTARCHGCVV